MIPEEEENNKQIISIQMEAGSLGILKFHLQSSCGMEVHKTELSLSAAVSVPSPLPVTISMRLGTVTATGPNLQESPPPCWPCLP